MRGLLSAATAILGAALVGVSLPNADTTRHQRALDNALVFVPDGRQLQLASSGQAEVMADLLWVRAILLFGERYDQEPSGSWTLWLRRMIYAVNTLDPRWRTAYFYGGAILRVSNDIEGSDTVFRQATEYIPNDPIFPFSLGMNAYLYRDDPGTAAEWIEKAARLPTAPSWYGAAAAAMRQSAGARESAIQFLEELVRDTTNDAVREDSLRQLGRLRHNTLVESWTALCHSFEAERGRPLASPGELAAYAGRALPENPRGDAWIVGNDGVVRSEGADKERLTKLRTAEWRLLRGG